MPHGSSDRYFQSGVNEANKLVPEGIEGRVAYKGSVADIIYQMDGGLRAGMGYVGAANLKDLNDNAQFVQITGAGLRESHLPANIEPNITAFPPAAIALTISPEYLIPPSAMIALPYSRATLAASLWG
mgnify:CR=1 FL=1